MLKIGVFVCWCGSNIAATVDVDAVAEAMKSEPNVVYSTNYQYMCSAAGQKMIQDAIHDYQLDGIVVCSCSPRMHEATFRKTAQNAGLNSYMVEIANIREQCSWIHKDKAEGTAKAIVLAKAADCQAARRRPADRGHQRCYQTLSGTRRRYRGHSDRAGCGRRRLRGRYSRAARHHRRPHGAAGQDLPHAGLRGVHTDSCKMVEASQNETIDIISYAKVEKVSGFVGNFTATITRKRRALSMRPSAPAARPVPPSAPLVRARTSSTWNSTTAAQCTSPFAQAMPNVSRHRP